MNFATLQGLTIPEGAVTQIADASGMVLWMAQNDKPIVLQVQKFVSDTYANETEYTGESFILLDIYPKKSTSTVKISYGGLTKALTFTGTNAQQVYFGTFNGVSDSTTTPTSGTLVIEGGCSTVGLGTYKKVSSGSGTDNVKTTTVYCDCVTAFVDISGIKTIAANAFNSTSMTSVTLSDLDDIGSNAFANSSVTSVTLTNVKSIQSGAFSTGTLQLDATIYGLPEVMPQFAFEGDDDSTCNIRIIDSQFDWDKWAQTDRPYTVTIEHESVGGTDKERINVYINGVLTSDITTVNMQKCTKIGDFAFRAFRNLQNLTIPDSVTEIGEYSFADAVKFPTLFQLPSGLKTIGNGAFYENRSSDTEKSEVSIIIPSSVIEIGNGAFNGTYKCAIAYVTILATTPPTAGSDIFDSRAIVSITVPSGCGEAYKAADGWSTYADKIVEAT